MVLTSSSLAAPRARRHSIAQHLDQRVELEKAGDVVGEDRLRHDSPHSLRSSQRRSGKATKGVYL
jgi:hypothetical protein